uniref:TRAF-like protein n=1 Tax=Tanacetum cinerariifolium TaxID=118510 RepID=A0A699K852_TANCI|nr:TRAF-like protein [Tanacetum cinerariifolium]
MEVAPSEAANTVDTPVVDDPPSARFTWTIENFSRLTGKNLYSDVFVVGGYKWRVLIFPKGNNVDHLSMYLDVADSTALPYGWSRYVQFSLAVKMVKSSSSSKNEIFDDSFCSTSCKKNIESLNTKITELSEKLSDSKTMLYHYKLGISQVKARLVEFKNQEIKFCEKIRGLEFNVKCKNNRIERLANELDELKKEKEGLESKLTGFEYAVKDLDTLLESQRSNKNKEGLGYSDVPPPPA